VSSDPVAWNGPLMLSFTDRRNSSLRSSDTTGRALWKTYLDPRSCYHGLPWKNHRFFR